MADAPLYRTQPPFTDFARVVDPTAFTSVPGESWLVLTDIVNSTRAIAAGRYKAVNMAGAAVIGAVMNALGHRDFPFVFGGDGATLIVEPAELAVAREAVAATQTWVREDIDLDLRAAIVPVADIRANGRDLRVARFAPSPAVSYAILMGGGVEWAETQMKAGAYAVAPAPAGARPDLTGLSCRWEPMLSRYGTMLSLIVRPGLEASPAAYAATIRMLLDLISGADKRDGHPVPEAGPPLRWPPKGLGLEALASRGRNPGFLRKLVLLGRTLGAHLVFQRGKPFGRFDPKHYRRQNMLNADYRKFDDGLRMTVDCREATALRVERLLADAEREGVVRFGVHRQAAAQMTCIVPSVIADDHFHFVDGAGGGYAAAAARLRQAGSAAG